MDTMPAPQNPHTQYRLFDFDVDSTWARKYNEKLGEIRRLQIAAAILAVVCLGGAVVLGVVLGSVGALMIAFVLGLFGLGCLAMIFYIPRKMGQIDRTYATSELVPAIVANVHPHVLTLVALVDQAVDRSAGSIPALVTLSAQKLPGHDRKEGERVPCVAVAGNRSARGKDNAYQFISPMPIAWGTGDKDVIRRAAKQIPTEEWDTVRRNVGRFEEIQKSPGGIMPL